MEISYLLLEDFRGTNGSKFLERAEKKTLFFDSDLKT